MRRIAAILFLATTLVACGGGSTGGGTTIELTSADAGSAVPARVGDRIVISLEANPTTGYSWQQVPGLDESVVKFVSEDYQQAPASPNMVGVGGTDTLTYEAVGEGTTTVALGYQRSGDATAAESFTVTVTVTR
jgi:inhibitor of cysteine peptidase